MEDFAKLKRKGIDVDDDNNPAPEKIPQTNNITKHSETSLNWTGAEDIVCPIFASNLPDTTTCSKITLTKT